MRRTPIALLMLLSVLLAACTAGDRQQRLAQLQMLEQRNIDDSLMTDDALAEQLADYFDRHGTPNERLRAHYILGRTYADLGEAPAALNAYQDAADCADTTAQDCDWAKLSRVYGQMSDVFYRQNLMQDYLQSVDQAVFYAWKAKDTLQALRESTMKTLGYYKLEHYDSVVALFDRLSGKYYQAYKPLFATNGIILIASYLKTGDIEKAKQHIVSYESESGSFDSLHNIAKGREAFYYYKGTYFLHTHQYDSAQYYFNKELAENKDFMNQNMAAQGLARLYQHEQKTDSALWYLQYSYLMNDSAYRLMSTDAVKNASALYNYNRLQQEAEREHERAIQESRSKTLLAIALLLLLTMFLTSVIFWLIRKKEMEMKYQKSINELSLLMVERESLQSQKKLIEKQLLQEQETVTSQLQQQIDVLTSRISAYSEQLKQHANQDAPANILAEKRLETSPVYQELITKADAAKKLKNKEWKEVEEVVESIFPGFYNFLYSHKRELTENEYKICILFRLHMRMKQTAGFIDIAKSQVSTISKGLLRKMFQEEGSGRELKKHLESIF